MYIRRSALAGLFCQGSALSYEVLWMTIPLSYSKAISAISLAAVLSACSGGAGGTLVPAALGSNTSVQAAALPPSMMSASPSLRTAITVPSNVFSLAGPITDMIASGFTIQAGGSVGYIHILTGTSTDTLGGSPKVGQYAMVTGTGSPSTHMLATTVSLYAHAPAHVTYSGAIKSATAYGFTIALDSTHPNFPVILNSTTTLSGSVAVGKNVQVAGVGAKYRSVTAAQVSLAGGSPTPTPTPIAMTHVLTSDLLGGVDGGTHSIAWSQATPYLTWAQTSPTWLTRISAPANFRSPASISPKPCPPAGRLRDA